MNERRRTTKTHFETVPLDEVIRRLHGDRRAMQHEEAAAQRARTRSGLRATAVHRGRILSLSYDVGLLETRRLLLESHGYEVTSAVGLSAAIDALKRGPFDLVIIGNSIPVHHKRMMLAELHAASQTPVLSLRGPSEKSLPEVEHQFDPLAGPRAFLEFVDRIFARDRDPQPSA